MGGEKIRQYKIGILDGDTAYMLNLMNYINSERDNPLFALAFSGAEDLMNYLESKELDAVVIDESIKSDVCPNQEDCRCIYLTGERQYGRSPGAYMDDNRIFKYSKAGDIISAILKIMNVSGKDNGRRVFRSYGVISPLGRCGKTNLAVSLCMGDEVRGGLYIGLEEYSPCQDGEDVISNMVYLAKQRSDKFSPYVESHVTYMDGYSRLGQLRMYNDALEICGDDMFWMMERLENWGRFTTVVCDIGQAVLKDIHVLEAFDEVIVPVLRDEISECKVKAFEDMLSRQDLGKLLCRIKKVYVPDVLPGNSRLLALVDDLIRR